MSQLALTLLPETHIWAFKAVFLCSNTSHEVVDCIDHCHQSVDEFHVDVLWI